METITMYTVRKKEGAYWNARIGGCAYPAIFEIFKEEAEEYCQQCKSQFPILKFEVVKIEIKIIK